MMERISDEQLELLVACDSVSGSKFLVATELLATRKQLAELQERTRWIPVEERLPEKESTECWEMYLCKLNRYGEVLIAPLWFLGGSFYNGYGVNIRYDEYVTHWMPLPELPEEN